MRSILRANRAAHGGQLWQADGLSGPSLLEVVHVQPRTRIVPRRGGSGDAFSAVTSGPAARLGVVGGGAALGQEWLRARHPDGLGAGGLRRACVASAAAGVALRWRRSGRALCDGAGGEDLLRPPAALGAGLVGRAGVAPGHRYHHRARAPGRPEHQRALSGRGHPGRLVRAAVRGVGQGGVDPSPGAVAGDAGPGRAGVHDRAGVDRPRLVVSRAVAAHSGRGVASGDAHPPRRHLRPY